MPEMRESVILAVLATTLLAIPAASQNVEITEDDGYSGTIESKFSDRFEIDFEPGKMTMEMTDSEAKFHVNKSYRRNTYVLRTPKGYVRKVETSDSIVKTVQTPYGRFVSGFRNGENISEFNGSHKSRARELEEKLEKRFEERLAEARDRKQIVMDQILPDIEVEAETDDDTTEHFVLENTGSRALDLAGWKISAEDSDGEVGDTLKLEMEMEPGDKEVFYSSDREELEEADYEVPESAVLDSGVNIYNGGGAVKLYNEKDRLIDSYGY